MGKKQRTEFIARGLLINKGQVLFCRNKKSGYCFLPGGHIEFGEQAAIALSREFKEETGLESSVGPLLLTTEQWFDDGKKVHHELNVVFHVEQLGPAPTPPEVVPSIEDKIEFAWIDLAQIPDTDVRPDEIKAWLMSGGATCDSAGPWLSGFESLN
ncbi:MAG: NUDIX domain-containing protein [Phycisphaerales bacterium]|nr:NUDIX domain-containing protein [Phycisphaerales bacterium]